MNDIKRGRSDQAAHDASSITQAETEHEDNPDSANDSDNPKKKRGHPQTLKQKWGAMHLPNKLNVIFSALIFAATSIYAGFSGWQLHIMKEQLGEIRESSGDTHALAEAAKTQAVAADTQSKQAIEQTAKMAQSLTRTDNLIKATSDLAKESHRQANIAKDTLTFSQESADQDRRPWVGIQLIECNGCTSDQDGFTIGSLVVGISNTGRTPAINLHIDHVLTSVKWTDPIPDIDTFRKNLRERNRTTTPDLRLNNLPPEIEAQRAKSEADTAKMLELMDKDNMPPS